MEVRLCPRVELPLLDGVDEGAPLVRPEHEDRTGAVLAVAYPDRVGGERHLDAGAAPSRRGHVRHTGWPVSAAAGQERGEQPGYRLVGHRERVPERDVGHLVALPAGGRGRFEGHQSGPALEE